MAELEAERSQLQRQVKEQSRGHDRELVQARAEVDECRRIIASLSAAPSSSRGPMQDGGFATPSTARSLSFRAEEGGTPMSFAGTPAVESMGGVEVSFWGGSCRTPGLSRRSIRIPPLAQVMYLKNVVLKFLEAAIMGKLAERDSLIPAVARVVHATPADLRRIDLALRRAKEAQASIFSAFGFS